MDRYEIVERIGAGGMAEVFLARHLGIAGFRRNVALKRLTTDDEARFIDEARIGAQLSHPNIVQIYDFGRDSRGLYIAMEYVDGASLATARRPIAMPIAVFIVAELARAAAYAHRARDVDGKPLAIVHRDITPHNVLLSRTGDVKLTDFGIAHAAIRNARTQPGSVTGKLAYMAPEQLAGGAVDGRADVFSLGVMLWELTLGRSAFETAASRTSRDPIPAPRTFAADYPAMLDDIVCASVALDREQRPTAVALAQVLDRYLAESGVRVTRDDVAALVDAARPVQAAQTGTAMTAIHAIAIGSRIGQYEITQRLGEGGMGFASTGRDASASGARSLANNFPRSLAPVLLPSTTSAVSSSCSSRSIASSRSGVPPVVKAFADAIGSSRWYLRGGSPGRFARYQTAPPTNVSVTSNVAIDHSGTRGIAGACRSAYARDTAASSLGSAGLPATASAPTRITCAIGGRETCAASQANAASISARSSRRRTAPRVTTSELLRTAARAALSSPAVMPASSAARTWRRNTGRG